MRTSLAWVCTTYLQDSVYSVFQNETEANKDVSPLFPGNSRLTMLLTEMKDDELLRLVALDLNAAIKD